MPPLAPHEDKTGQPNKNRRARAVLLGTGPSVPSLDQQNTALALIGETHTVLIDCGPPIYLQLLRAGINVSQVDSVVLTHFHPDHVDGLPALVMAMWIARRREPLHVYAGADTAERTAALLGLHRVAEWPGRFPLHAHTIGDEAGAEVLRSDDFVITSAPTAHYVPSIGLRVVNRRSGAALAYSGDTAPCDAVLALAQGADLLLHESTGPSAGHSSASQAGEIAQKAHVRRLALVHYDAQRTPPEALVTEARRTFDGDIHAGRDLDVFSW